MKTYTINGKEYSEFDINKRIAQIIHEDASIVRSIIGENMVTVEGGGFAKIMIDYCNNPADTWPIIESIKDELLHGRADCLTEWDHLIRKHKCSMLTAACICFIEMSDSEY